MPPPAVPSGQFLLPLLHPGSLPLLLIVLLSVLAGALAYQAPPTGVLRVGWLGDQLFLSGSGGLGSEPAAQGAFYPDELTPDSPTQRSRWTRQQAQVVLPNLGAGADLELTLLVQGWPADVRGPPASGVQPVAGTLQPLVSVQVDGTPVGSFVPAPTWEQYQLSIPAEARSGADLHLTLTSSAVFTDTERGSDPRPKGIRLAEIEVDAPMTDMTTVLPPAWRAVGMLTLAAVLLYALLLRVLGSPALGFLAAIVATGMACAGLALLRIWMGAALLLSLWLLLIALLIAWQRPLLWLLRALLRRSAQGYALNYGLIAAALVWLGFTVAELVQRVRAAPGAVGLLQHTFPDSLLFGMLSMGALSLLLVLGREGLPRLADWLVRWLGGSQVAPLLLLLLGGLWLCYEATVIAQLPYVGHADYADNAVVARNLAAGRGWVVDYVSQFYYLYDGVTRPQETWPLLQPVWMAPFIALFGPEAWAAKIPNLLFNTILLLLIYHIGVQLWDRRVGLVAALLTLTNYLFFNLTIYTTSDLAFVVFALGAVYLMYRAGTQPPDAPRPLASRALIGAGLLTGLLMLQKPSGALIAVGMGLWLIAREWRFELASLRRLALRFALWAGLALLLLSPYMLRNVALFGTPVYSTERYDAWVLGYRGDSGEAWNDIYRIYTPELGGPGLPDRSWILRWGFDYTYEKFETQLDALRDYLLPAWTGLPDFLAGEDGRPYFFSRSATDDSQSKSLFGPLGAWLALLGLIAALIRRRVLLTLLFFAFTPYILFLLTYWRTNEERYFLMLMPWMALLIAWMIWAGYDRLAAIGDRRWAPLGLILVFVAISGIMQPSWPEIATKVQTEPQVWAPDVAAYEWLAEHTPPDAVVMTRNPWQLNWHARRPAVMIPNTNDRELFDYVADYYDAEYIVFENVQRVKGDAIAVVGPLADARYAQPGEVIAGFELVYASPTPTNRALIYRFPEGDRWLGREGE
jgi:4-amino-4-deoxy-L-arabinose transferase-like glycosyltransferase